MGDKTLEESKMRFVYSWLNTNPVFVLKCKYFFQGPDGEDTEHRGDHPIACGEDDTVVRFFEVGKEYLFIRPERQNLLARSLADFMEPEYWVDRAFWQWGQIAGLVRSDIRERRRKLEADLLFR